MATSRLVTGHNYSESPNSGHTSDTKCNFKTIIIMLKTLVLFNIFVEIVIPFFFFIEWTKLNNPRL